MPDWKDAPTSPVRALVRRPASTEAFRTQRYPAGAELEPWLEYLWTVDWDLRDAEPVTSTVISYPALHLTAEWGPSGELRHGHPMPATLVHGAASRVFVVELLGLGAVVGARFRPGGAHPWTGRDASTLVDRAVPASELLAPALARLHEELADREPEARADGFRTALAAHRPTGTETDGELDAVVERMAEDTRLVRVEQVVTDSGWSLRTLQRRFRQHLGVSPRWVLARFRLQQAALALEQDPDLDLAALAVRLGWYDQAHLTNDFRRMLGETPARYAARSR